MVENRRFIKFCRSTKSQILHKFAVNVRFKTNTTLKKYRPDGRRFQTAVKLDLPQRRGTPAQTTESNSSITRSLLGNFGAIGRATGTRTEQPALRSREKLREPEINQRKLLICTQNPEPDCFIKISLYTDGYFNSQLPTFLNIHYSFMSILTQDSKLQLS